MLNTTLKSTGASLEAGMVLASYCNEIGSLSGNVHAAARRTLLDTLGVAAAGMHTEASHASKRAATDIWGQGSASVWFSSAKLTPPGAAFVNSTYAAALDLDDGHRQASGHPAAAIVPAVLAIAGGSGIGADRLLTAIAIGYEVGVRISAARDINRLRTTDTGVWCGPGVAAATGWLTNQPTPVIAHAIAIAAQTATSQAATGWTKLGHTVKEGIPWATANGVAAVSLAAAGHRGPLDILDDPDQYMRQSMLGEFGDTWAIEKAYFKLYSCCRWAHAAIDAALALKARHCLVPEEIEGLFIETFDRALTLPNQSEPQSIEAAQYSVPFCVALALVHGDLALLPMEKRHLSDARVIKLALRITVSSSNSYAAAFPDMTPARVTISARGTTDSIELLFPKGEPTNPLSPLELMDKFIILSSDLGTARASAIARAVYGLGIHKEPPALFAALGSST